ncbi:MAG: hypothetical protein GQ578_05225 [Desulfuromonadaceae bacterium]|nr:hypothetical protein [Desulfuromonadaceae bacterium]
MKKIIFLIFLLGIFPGPAHANTDENSTIENTQLQQKNIATNNELLVELLRKNSQQSVMITGMQQRILKLEYKLYKTGERLKRLEYEVLKR